MQPTTDNFPVFEANQVLTNAHLNQSFDYLDEQERLTRANLIGIGIVCGLNLSLDNAALPTALLLSKGCGVTSEGYLIVEPNDVTLTSYRQYTLPPDLAYAPLSAATLWELFPAGEPETALLTNPAGFLNDKAVLLFLELKKEALRNCSVNNCDDKGAKITMTVRRLLISKTELEAIIAASASLEGMPNPALQFNLPDIRMPRFDAPATTPTTSNALLAAFLKVFTSKKLAAAMGEALTQAYQAFQPILLDSYASNPFSNFAAQFGFLDSAPSNVEQVRFLQYYYDFFDDLIRAYDEFCTQGAELLCACCPPSGLFPRHLMLSLLYPASDIEASHFRHTFIASAAIGDCETGTQNVVTLFRRLVEMTVQFTLTPLPPMLFNTATDAQIRITPSKQGDVSLSSKAIPYYYLNEGLPPLNQLWNPALTRRIKANRNLGYRADEFIPTAPAFVTEPLAYDLEPYNFLRVEGHLGKSYQSVLKTVLELKARYRLPIDVVALRTGAFNSNIPVDLTKESCRFQDLESLYATNRNQIICELVHGLTYFYNITYQTTSPVTTAVKSQFAVINSYAPDFLVKPNTLGRLFEDYITSQGGIVAEIDANILASWINIFPPVDSLVYYSFFSLIKLSDDLPEALAAINFTTVDTRFKNLDIVVTAIESRREAGRSNLEGNVAVLTWEEIDDRLEDLQHTCQSEVMNSLQSEYESRITELKKKQFFSNFVQNHPGIQHKAGVPMGGTFIVVYHQDPPANTFVPLNPDILSRAIDPMASGVLLSAHTTPSNLGTIVFPPFIMTKPPVKLGDTSVKDGLSINIRDSNSVSLKTGTAKPDLVNNLTAEKNGKLTLTSLTASNDKISITDNTPLKAFDRSNTNLIGSSAINNGLTNAVAAGVGQVTVNQALLDAINGLQAQPALITPDIQNILDGLTTLLPSLPIIPIFPGPFEFPTPADGIIAATVNDLADGSVIADFFLPYLCCSNCPPIEFVLPKAPPTFSISIGCTDPNQEVAVAEVTITAKDGTPPYRLQIDTGIFAALNNPYLLSAGEHTLIIQDADNVQSSPQTITISEPLSIGVPTFTCTPDGLTYNATLSITGGEPPYSVNDALISGANFTSTAVASGTALALRITDTRQCEFETTLTHTCPLPCDLPDDGLSRRCAYRLWLQPAIDNETYEDYKQTSGIRFSFNGQNIDLGVTDDLLQIPANDLNGDFRNALGSVIKRLNEAVNKGLDETFGSLSRNRLTISYEPSRTDPFGIFWIEHFINDVFSIEFDFGFNHSVASGEFSVHYGALTDATGANFDGGLFINRNQDNQQTRIPAFACSDRNQCNNTDFIPLCDGFELSPAFDIERNGENVFSFSITEAMPSTGIAAWIWQFTTSTDSPFYVGDKISVVWNNVGGLIKLTAISDKGCFSTTLADRR